MEKTKKRDGKWERAGVKDSSPQVMQAIFIGNLHLRGVVYH